MKATAVIEVERRGGRDVLTRLRSDPPLSVRDAGDRVHLVGSGAGPLGGDDLVLRIRVGPGASLTVATVAASMVLPGPSGAPSRYRLDAEVAEGGHLTFLPEPQILVRGCDHEMHTTIALGTHATLRWRDETVLGRHEEATGSLLHRVRITRGQNPVLRSDVAVGPRWPESLGPGGIDGARALGTLVVTTSITSGPITGPVTTSSAKTTLRTSDQQPAREGCQKQQPSRAGCLGGSLPVGERVRSAVLELDDGTVVRSAVGDSARAVRQALSDPELVRT